MSSQFGEPTASFQFAIGQFQAFTKLFPIYCPSSNFNIKFSPRLRLSLEPTSTLAFTSTFNSTPNRAEWNQAKVNLTVWRLVYLNWPEEKSKEKWGRRRRRKELLCLLVTSVACRNQCFLLLVPKRFEVAKTKRNLICQLSLIYLCFFPSLLMFAWIQSQSSLSYRTTYWL